MQRAGRKKRVDATADDSHATLMTRLLFLACCFDCYESASALPCMRDFRPLRRNHTNQLKNSHHKLPSRPNQRRGRSERKLNPTITIENGKSIMTSRSQPLWIPLNAIIRHAEKCIRGNIRRANENFCFIFSYWVIFASILISVRTGIRPGRIKQFNSKAYHGRPVPGLGAKDFVHRSR